MIKGVSSTKDTERRRAFLNDKKDNQDSLTHKKILRAETLLQIRKEPQEASRERAQLAREASAAKRQSLAVKNDEKTKMKGKNRPSRSYRKKKTNIIDEKKVNFKYQDGVSYFRAALSILIPK